MVDAAVIAELLPHLYAGDTIIDGGNSQFRDTQRRAAEMEKNDAKRSSLLEASLNRFKELDGKDAVVVVPRDDEGA